ncbi:hypothetical protein HRW16_14120 [Streptomyces lunaelactis]|uniref:hypothetical protein n=2 Tax=Streptomyces lunaelactis TaxID=1535768 RepID=UPI00158466AF|nr:hypothetical protein [Streptomyces lunaelactis]NUK92965.1 hypothetical protein [Streptomyces lunaelactis]NUL29224.1 hypothetical protein [Streptomyces lunaelactis]
MMASLDQRWAISGLDGQTMTVIEATSRVKCTGVGVGIGREGIRFSASSQNPLVRSYLGWEPSPELALISLTR